MEHIGDEIREKWFVNKVFDSMDAVEDILMDALVTLENDKKKNAGISWLFSIGLLVFL